MVTGNKVTVKEEHKKTKQPAAGYSRPLGESCAECGLIFGQHRHNCSKQKAGKS